MKAMEPFAFEKLGAIHEENPEGFKLGTVQAPITLPAQYLCDDNGPTVSPEILMQGQSPECGGYSLATLIGLLHKVVDMVLAPLSGSFSYAYEKTVDGVPGEQGTVITAVGKAGNTVGSCLDTLFPDDGTLPAGAQQTPFSTATPEAIADGKTRSLGTPFLLDDLSFEGIAQAIYQNGAVILQVAVGKEWWSAPSGAISWAASDILPIRPPETVIDGHFICVGAFDQKNDRLWFANSWSTQWGQNGWGYIQSNYLPYIKAGIAFKPIPPSVNQALTAGQVDIARQICIDLGLIVQDIEEEVKQTIAA